MTQQCSRCGQVLPVEAFYWNKTRLTYDKYCRECRKAKIKAGSVARRRVRRLIVEAPTHEERMSLILEALAEVERRKELHRKALLEAQLCGKEAHGE